MRAGSRLLRRGESTPVYQVPRLSAVDRTLDCVLGFAFALLSFAFGLLKLTLSFHFRVADGLPSRVPHASGRLVGRTFDLVTDGTHRTDSLLRYPLAH